MLSADQTRKLRKLLILSVASDNLHYDNSAPQSIANSFRNKYLREFERLTIGGTGVKFRGTDVRLWCGPLVYMLMLDGDPLYIGLSRNGMSRLFAPHRQAKRAKAECDEVMAWPTATIEDAQRLEMLMINALLPKYNKLQYFDGGSVFRREVLSCRE